MFKKQSSHHRHLPYFRASVCLTTSALTLLINSMSDQVSASVNITDRLAKSLLYPVLTSDNLTIAQAIPPIPPNLTIDSAAIIDIPGLPAPLPVYDPPIEPIQPLEPIEPTGYIDEGLDHSASDSTGGALPPPIPFSLKSVRQSVNIALPSEPEASHLPELPFKKMYPGVVGQSDAEVEGRRVDFYQFEGTQDQQIVMVLRNSNDPRPNGLALMPYMMVFDPTGKVMAGTIIPGEHRIATTDPLLPLDNQLALRLPQSGRYVVAIFTNPGETGRYGIGWTQDATRFRYDETRELTSVESTEPAEITGKAGQVINIQASSYEFDPIVTLVDANGNVISRDDDDGGNYNARIDIALPADGIYRAMVTSVDGQGRGQYRLRIR